MDKQVPRTFNNPMMKMMNHVLCCLLLLSGSGCSAKAGDIPLVRGGKTRHVIVLPAAPTKVETRAAGVFQDYIQRISGAKLMLIPENKYEGQPAVFIGNTTHGEDRPPEKIAGEGFYLGTQGQDLYIRGGSGQGLLYGVYRWLENYTGCRKYAGKAAMVPASPDISLPQELSVLASPRFIYRQTYYPAAEDPEYMTWHGLHSFEDLWGLWGHSFFKILPPATWFREHPEYYALVNGKRRASQLCLSNEAVYRHTIEYFRKAIQEHPDAVYWSIAPNDDNGYCTCEQCKKADMEEGGPQGSLIRFVNKVAAQFPNHYFTTLAYGYSAQPPLKTKPAANVYIMLSTIDAQRQEPLRTSATAAPFRRQLKGWGALTPNLFIWDYTTQFTNYLSPFPDYHHLQDNLRYFVQHQVKGVFSQGSGTTYSDAAEYNSYVQALLLWNPEADITALQQDFFKGYYGDAGKYIAQYMNALTKAVAGTRAVLDIYGNPVNSHTDYLSPALIDQYAALLDQAEKAADDTLYSGRVQRMRLPLEYTVLQQSRFYGTEKYGYLIPEKDSSHFIVNDRWPARVQRFVEACKKAGVTELSEGGLSPDGYAQEWAGIFARKWDNSLAFRAPVTLAAAYTKEFSPKKEHTLTDGVFGTKDFSYNWLYYYHQDLDATIDLGSIQVLHTISMNFLQDARHYIFLPETLRIMVADDGQHFREAGNQAVPAAEEDYAVNIHPFRFTLNGVKARYIRVTAKCPAALPAWRDVLTPKLPAICVDEVVVR